MPRRADLARRRLLGVFSHGADEADRAMEQVMRFGGILRRRWLVVAVTTVLAVAGAFAAISHAEAQVARARDVVLHLAGPQVLDKVKGVSDDNEGRLFAYKEYYQTQREIIGSRIVAERALGTLGLAQDPVFLGVDGIGRRPSASPEGPGHRPVERLRELVFVEEVRGSRCCASPPTTPTRRSPPTSPTRSPTPTSSTSSRAAPAPASPPRTTWAASATRRSPPCKAAEKALADFKQAHGISSISLADRQNVITEAIIATNANLKDAEADASPPSRPTTRPAPAQGRQPRQRQPAPAERARLFEDMRSEQLEAEREVEQLSVKYGDKMPDLQQARRRLA
jgi:succinoglycan biosynthesis transport protein ExoP